VVFQEIFAEANVDMIAGGGQNLVIATTTGSADSDGLTGDELAMIF
jgi:hypothetical protein